MMCGGAGQQDESSRTIERARALWRDGDTQGALSKLKTALRARPEAEDVRRVLVGFYREIRHLDQAGRWAIAVDGWTTELERERLARLLAQSPAARADLKKFLALPTSPDDIPEVGELMTGPVEKYIALHAEQATIQGDRENEWFFEIMMLGWVATVIAFLLGTLAVYISTVFDIGDPQGLARFVGFACASLAGLVLLAGSADAAVDRRWIKTAVVGSLALAVTSVSVVALVSLLTA